MLYTLIHSKLVVQYPGRNYMSSIKRPVIPKSFSRLIFKKYRRENSFPLVLIPSFTLLLNVFLFIIFCFIGLEIVLYPKWGDTVIKNVVYNTGNLNNRQNVMNSKSKQSCFRQSFEYVGLRHVYFNRLPSDNKRLCKCKIFKFLAEIWQVLYVNVHVLNNLFM